MSVEPAWLIATTGELDEGWRAIWSSGGKWLVGRVRARSATQPSHTIPGRLGHEWATESLCRASKETPLTQVAAQLGGPNTCRGKPPMYRKSRGRKIRTI